MTQKTHRSLEFFKDARNRLGMILNDMARIAEERGDLIVDNQSTVARASSNPGEYKRPLSEMLEERARTVLERNAFRLAVVGKFNAGKSSLLNALMHRNILAVASIPKTAAITVLRHDQKEGYRVTYKEHSTLADRNTGEIIYTDNLEADLVNVTSDDANAVLGGKQSITYDIDKVEVWCNSEFLDRQLLEIIDTPGLYSVFIEHGRVTERVIPEVDAVLFLFPFDPGFGEEEQDFTAFIRNYLNLFLFVMTKTDLDRYESNEVEQQTQFVTNVIEKIAKIPIRRVHPVSARAALKGRWNDSGLELFLSSLEDFLVSSTGIIRLQTPFDIAVQYNQKLGADTARDIEMIDESVESLKRELDALTEITNSIEGKRSKLLNLVKSSMNGMLESAIEGLDDLPIRLEKRVEKEIENYNKEALKKIDLKLPILIQEQVEAWVKRKEQSFASEAKKLQQRVQEDLDEISSTLDVFDVQAGRTPQRVNIPDVASVSAGRAWRLGSNTAIKSGAAFGLSLVGSVIAFAVLGVFSPVLILLAPILPMIRAIGNSEKLIRDDIKKRMKEPLPNNNYDLFQAVAEGYVDENGETKPGLRRTLTEGFSEWGKSLQNDIDDFVTNLVESRLDQLKRQITDKESEQWDRESRMKMYCQHQEQLEAIQRRLETLSRFFEDMQTDNGEE